MKTLRRDEYDTIKQIIAYGGLYGYGNLILHLQTAWARRMMENGIDEHNARAIAGACESGYPFAMWDDLMQNGEWDETGKKYK